MRLAGEIIWWCLAIYMWMIVARVIIGWLPVRWPPRVRPLIVLVYDLTEPVLSPLRRIIPSLPVASGVSLDLTPMVVIMVIVLAQWLVRNVFG